MPSLVSVVIPCYNPPRFLEEAVASVRAQDYRPIEIILVDDGTDSPGGRRLLQSLAPTVTRYIEQPNLGLAAARNAGFRAASGEYVAPLDADDKLAPTFLSECVAALAAHPEHAFVYTDYRVFGEKRYTERLPDYNLYRLLSQNTLIYASLLRRADWELAGGYDDSMRLGYEDWDFWLRLGERERFGHHLPRPLFHYRKHGRSLLDVAREHHRELVEKIRANHPRLYSRQGRARLKARWQPSVCVLGPELETVQTIEDWHRLPTTDTQVALERSSAAAFLLPAPGASSDAAELCALAVWGGHSRLVLRDGSTAMSRGGGRGSGAGGRGLGVGVSRFESIGRHLANAELRWRYPVRSAVRLIPLRVKERVNRAAGRAVFDLSFYLRFQPHAVLTGELLIEPLRYLPCAATQGRRRVALVTPHLGPGGAESVLLEVARAIDRARCEIFLITTQSRDDRWRSRWEQAADHVYDLAAVVPPERLIAALYSMATNWELDALVIQNSLAAYSALPHIRKDLPALEVADFIHAVDPRWDFVSATAAVAPAIDRRVAISDAARRRLLEAGTPAEKVRLIRNGVDLARFRASPPRNTGKILFGGRLDPVKRPMLLVDIASELARLRPQQDFRFVVAGDGPEGPRLRARAEPALFEFLGMAEDMPALLSEADIVVVPSRAEGLPLILLEAFAAARPVVCSRVGAAGEVVDAGTGILIEPGQDEARRFAGALHQLLDSPQRGEMGSRARQKVEADYSRTRAYQEYRQLFEELLTAKTPRRQG